MRIGDAQFKAIMAKARTTNASRSASERRAGFSSLESGPPREFARTAMLAIEAGIKSQDWDCVAEGLAMLEDYIAVTYAARV